ncbi:hypothetical protein H5410_030147 [Solanum commersonii]|uniref:Uncharacterized protein n=1 Tax=Solanum commersonii TaxID=4109 RepID=A0A9J5YET4_SOLCO|nr:hypothetical protein H5410_030147 [Solanum commersonii]
MNEGNKERALSLSLIWRHGALSTAIAAPSSPQPQVVQETFSKINYASLLHANSSSKPSEEILYWVFPWSQRFNVKEETSIALIYISFPSLPPNMFARKALLSIASVVGKPLAIDKATQIRSRPNTKGVKVLVDLLDKHPKRIKLFYLDKKTGKVLEQYQEVMYDVLPYTKRFADIKDVLHSLEANNVEKLKGDSTRPRVTFASWEVSGSVMVGRAALIYETLFGVDMPLSL